MMINLPNPYTQTLQLCHIKLKKYVAAYMKCVYGGEPLVFPSNHAVSLILERSLVRDTDTENIPTKCITDLMWKLIEEQVAIKKSGKREMSLFAEEFQLKGNTKLLDEFDTESKFFFTIQLPEKGLRRGGYVIPDRQTRVSERGVTEIREMLSREFWMELFIFVREEQFRAAEKERIIRMEQIFENFCTLYEIPIQEIDNLQRKYRVERAKLREEIEEHRRAVNPDEYDFLNEGKPLKKLPKEERASYASEAISNYREDPGQPRGE